MNNISISIFIYCMRNIQTNTELTTEFQTNNEIIFLNEKQLIELK